MIAQPRKDMGLSTQVVLDWVPNAQHKTELAQFYCLIIRLHGMITNRKHITMGKG